MGIEQSFADLFSQQVQIKEQKIKNIILKSPSWKEKKSKEMIRHYSCQYQLLLVLWSKASIAWDTWHCWDLPGTGERTSSKGREMLPDRALSDKEDFWVMERVLVLNWAQVFQDLIQIQECKGQRHQEEKNNYDFPFPTILSRVSAVRHTKTITLHASWGFCEDLWS